MQVQVTRVSWIISIDWKHNSIKHECRRRLTWTRNNSYAPTYVLSTVNACQIDLSLFSNKSLPIRISIFKVLLNGTFEIMETSSIPSMKFQLASSQTQVSGQLFRNTLE